MSEDISVSIRLSVVICLTAAYISCVLTVLTMGQRIINNFTNSMVNQVNSVGYTSLLKCAAEPKIEGPVLYTVVIENLGMCSNIIIIKENSSVLEYNMYLNDDYKIIDYLYMGTNARYFKMEVDRDDKGFITLYIEEVT